MATNPLSTNQRDNESNSYALDRNGDVARRVTGFLSVDDRGLSGSTLSDFWKMFEKQFDCIRYNRVAQNEDNNYFYILLVEDLAIKGGFKVTKNLSGDGNNEAFLLTEADITLAVMTLPDTTVLTYTLGDIPVYGAEIVPVDSGRITATTAGVEAKVGLTRMPGRVNLVIYNASNQTVYAGPDKPVDQLIPIERKQSKVYVVNDNEKIVVKTETGTADVIIEEIGCGSY